MFLVGKIKKPHGIKGELVIAITGKPEFLTPKTKVIINDREWEIERIRPFQKNHLLKLKGVDDLNMGTIFHLKDVFLKERPILLKDEFYYEDLMNKEVVNLKGKVVGAVTDILELPRGLVLEIDNKLLVPFDYAFYKGTKNNKIIIDTEAFDED